MLYLDPYQIYSLSYKEGSANVRERFSSSPEEGKELYRIARSLMERPQGAYVDQNGVMVMAEPMTKRLFERVLKWALHTEFNERVRHLVSYTLEHNEIYVAKVVSRIDHDPETNTHWWVVCNKANKVWFALRDDQPLTVRHLWEMPEIL